MSSAVADQPVSRYGAPDRFEKRKLTLEQEELVKEFMSIYGIQESQISFEGESADPILDFDALCLIANELGDFPTITTVPLESNQNGRATAQCTITDGRGVTRSQFGSCFIGAPLPDGKTVDDDQTNLDVAQARALRRALRSIGFSVVSSHKSRMAGIVKPQSVPVDSQRVRDSKQLHALACELGYITSESKSKYQGMLATHFDGKISSKDLTDVEMSQAIAIFQALSQARERIVRRNNMREDL
jgi:hypothetical protein